MKYGIHWFRRDLRVAGNLALQRQFKENEGRVVGLFCLDKKFLARGDFSVDRFQFFLKTLEALKIELKQLGSDLLVVDQEMQKFLPELVSQLEKADQDLPATISWSRDYEPFARARDDQVKAILQKKQIEYLTERDHLLIEPEELEKAPGQGYQVYSPFARKWLEIFQTSEIQQRLRQQKSGFTYLRKSEKGQAEKIFKLSWKKLFKNGLPFVDALEKFEKDNRSRVGITIPPAGALQAFTQLRKFKKSIEAYGQQRDLPAVTGTSQLSMYLKNGSLTVPQIIAFLDLKPYQKKITGRDTYLSELIWREFYYHILHRHPRVENEAFLEKYKDLDWGNDKKWFAAWKEGRTGFPIVDAGMRELNLTGWMHNRVRMIVASFLTKDLLIDWRWGEKYFMDKLLDGDLAANNGGWQWAASTGCDPQPYFRIFNPWLQSKRFDPQGVYIKTYIPELEDVPAKALHQPLLGHASYPEPIVDHRAQRVRALALYKG